MDNQHFRDGFKRGFEEYQSVDINVINRAIAQCLDANWTILEAYFRGELEGYEKRMKEVRYEKA